MSNLLISQTGLSRDALGGKVAVVTGAGGGIGYEAARALLWLGAKVVIAEINEEKGQDAVQRLADEFDSGTFFSCTQMWAMRLSIAHLAGQTIDQFGKVDIVINNATIARLGLVADVPIEDWDASYRVNLRGPVLMARAFLPGMLERDTGVFVNVSSTGTAYMGAYETFKAAQVHLANTLDAELEGTGVVAFTIGPGLVPTETATTAIAELAPQLGWLQGILREERGSRAFGRRSRRRFCGGGRAGRAVPRAGDFVYPGFESGRPARRNGRDFHRQYLGQGPKTTCARPR
jgi:NAD(P)-dependent dehydrogenase (short-subunit alcohol dehydrogenase family)